MPMHPGAPGFMPMPGGMPGVPMMQVECAIDAGITGYVHVHVYNVHVAHTDICTVHEGLDDC